MGKFGKAASSTASTASGGEQKGKNITLLDLREVETKKGKATKIQLAKDVQILYKGEPVNFGEYNSAFMKNKDEMLSSLEFLVEKDYMSEADAEEKSNFYDEKGIVYQLTVKI